MRYLLRLLHYKAQLKKANQKTGANLYTKHINYLLFIHYVNGCNLLDIRQATGQGYRFSKSILNELLRLQYIESRPTGARGGMFYHITLAGLQYLRILEDAIKDSQPPNSWRNPRRRNLKRLR